MSKKRLSDEKVLAILKGLFEDNKTNTQVATEILGKRSKESTVRNIKRVYIKHGNYFGVTLNGEVNIEEDWVVPDNTLDSLCEHPDWNVSNLAKRLRSSQRSNNQLRKIQREVFDGEDSGTNLEKLLNDLSTKITKTKVIEIPTSESSTPATLEVMLSDIQIGKVTRHFNKDACTKAMKDYGVKLLQEIRDKSGKFKLEKIIVELLGDLTEDNTKHGIQSAISTDCGLSEQIYLVTENLWEYILSPLASLGVEIEVQLLS